MARPQRPWLAAATAFVFPAASAGTRIVATDFRNALAANDVLRIPSAEPAEPMVDRLFDLTRTVAAMSTWELAAEMVRAIEKQGNNTDDYGHEPHDATDVIRRWSQDQFPQPTAASSHARPTALTRQRTAPPRRRCAPGSEVRCCPPTRVRQPRTA